MITLAAYISRRLGRTPAEQARNFFGRPFRAASFTGFWQYWNPVWSYYLQRLCYQPLRRHLPRGPAVLLTFLICGLAHDAPFVLRGLLRGGRFPSFTLTAFFVLAGGLMVAAEASGLHFDRIPAGYRWGIHCLTLAGCYCAAVVLTVSA